MGWTQVYWLIEIPVCTQEGGRGTQTFVVLADSPHEAVQEAWAQAHTPRAEQRRKNAVLTVGCGDLFAREFR